METTEDITLSNILIRIKNEQSKRPPAYESFQKSFEEYLKDNDIVSYSNAVQETTKLFQEVSKNIRDIETILKNPPFQRDDIAGMVRRLQEKRRRKIKKND